MKIKIVEDNETYTIDKKVFYLGITAAVLGAITILSLAGQHQPSIENVSMCLRR